MAEVDPMTAHIVGALVADAWTKLERGPGDFVNKASFLKRQVPELVSKAAMLLAVANHVASESTEAGLRRAAAARKASQSLERRRVDAWPNKVSAAIAAREKTEKERSDLIEKASTRRV